MFSVDKGMRADFLNPDMLETGRMLLIPTNPQSWTVTPPSLSESPAPAPATPPAHTSQGSVPTATSVAKIDVTLAATPPVVKTSPNPMYNSWTYTIEVTQQDAQGNPVPNETLEVYGNAGANVTQVTTDAEGHASFTVTMTQQDVLSSPGGQTGIWVKDDAANVVGSTTFALPKVTGN